VRTFISYLKQYWTNRPFIWSESEDVFAKKIRLPTYGKVLVLGPHPDDPESVAITCRLLKRSGCDIWYAIASMSPSGVEDEFAQRWQTSGYASLPEKKIEIRRREQTCATEIFGLTPDRLAFLSIEEDKGLDSPNNLIRIRGHLEFIAPDIVIMPIGKDPNQTHAWVYQVFRQCAKNLTLKTEKPVIGLYNEDPKTIEMRQDLFVLFGEGDADWKRALLRVHDSQQQRNIYRRGLGFDERILRMNHLSYRRLQEISPPMDLSAKYAEVFEIELFDFPSLGTNE
jgi:LmbE family N-acetylglucosaminyl deacetylase